MRPRIRWLALAALLAADPARGADWGDTLTVVMRPLSNLPSFVVAGGELEVTTLGPAGATAWAAALDFAGDPTPLPPLASEQRADLGRWRLRFRVPPGTPADLYDLVVTSDATAPDTVRHAVQVVAGFPREFYFAQITDTHMPTPLFSSAGPIGSGDTTAVEDFAAVAADLAIVHPAFVLHTGDLVNEGELEELWDQFEMRRAQEALLRLPVPVFVVTGNHDIGGWQDTPAPDGTSRRAWWRRFGWPWLEDPPPGDPHHAQDYSFDFGALHVVGLEAYQYGGGYDVYRPDLWGAQSFTAEQMAWLAADLAAVPPGRGKVLFYHYDFGGTLPDGRPGPVGSQIDVAALGVEGAIWGHWHGVGEGDLAARPFDLGLQATVNGGRAFRVFRVRDGVITPGPMHHAGGDRFGPTDSLTVAWGGPNDGTRRSLTATVVNRYGEDWTDARLRFCLADHDSSFEVRGGWVLATRRVGGRAYVDVGLPLDAGRTVSVTVEPIAPRDVPWPPGDAGVALAAPAPNPYRPSDGDLVLRYAQQRAGRVRLTIHDLGGRRITTLLDGERAAGGGRVAWDGRDADGVEVPPGLYVARLALEDLAATRRILLIR